MNKHDRQARVRGLFREGRTKSEIAEEMGVTRKTVQRDLLNVPHGENVPLSEKENVPLKDDINVAPKDTKNTIWRKRLGVWEEFRRYLQPNQRFLSVANIEEMVRVNDAKLRAIKLDKI